MFDFKVLKERYEQAIGYTVFLEEGEMKDFYRKKNEIIKPVCGIYSVAPISITAIRSPFIGIATANITMLAPPDVWEDVRNKMDAVAEVLNGTSFYLKDNEGNEYSVAYNFQTASVEDRILDVGVGEGEVFPIHQSVSYIIVERGVSAYDARLWIDGMEVPVLTLVETNVHTTSVYPSGSGSGQTSSELEAFGIDFTTPYTTGELCKLFRKALNGRSGNDAHCVVVEKNGTKSCCLMQFANVSNSISPPQNIGFNVSMTELNPTVADFNGCWSQKQTNEGYGVVHPFLILEKEPTVHGVTVFWGDGEAEDFDVMSGSRYHIYKDGASKHTIRVFKRYSDVEVPLDAGMQLRTVGASVRFKADKDKVYASDISTNAAYAILTGPSANTYAPGLYIVNGSLSQILTDKTSIPFGDSDENGSYIPAGLRIQLGFDRVEYVSDFAKKHFTVSRQDLVSADMGV